MSDTLLLIIRCLLSGLSALAISIILGVALGETFVFATDYKVTAETFPWSALLFGVGGLISIVAAFMIAVIVIKWHKYGAYHEGEKEPYQDNGQRMSDLNRSYDRPRYPTNGGRADYYERDNRYDRDYASSRKQKEYDTRDNDKYNNRGYEPERSYERTYDQGRQVDRGYERNGYDRGYDQGRSYSQTRVADNMYRPYAQNRY